MPESPTQAGPKPKRLRSFFSGHRYRQLIASIVVAVPLVSAIVPVGFIIFDRFNPPVAPTLPAPSSPDMGSRVVRLEGQMEALLAVLIQDTPAPMPQVKPQVKPEDITVANWSNYEGRIGGVGRQEWLWEIFVKAGPPVLEKIECVTYTLHPSVSNPVRNVCDLGKSDRPFAASGESWATYTVDVTISFKESDAPDIHKAHTLTLVSP